MTGDAKQALLARMRERGGLMVAEMRVAEMRAFTDLADDGLIKRLDNGKWVPSDLCNQPEQA